MVILTANTLHKVILLFYCIVTSYTILKPYNTNRYENRIKKLRRNGEGDRP